ncbi:DNA-directed RNA polymerase II subunit RPB2, partial [Tanacetum coccineum]
TIYKIKFYLGKPMMTESDGGTATLFPKAARLRNLTYVPIMVKSSHCALTHSSEKDLSDLRECPYDQGGYFIINGSEKVLIAQERMSSNHVYVFKKRQPNKYAYVAEVRSMVESQNKPPSAMFVHLLAKASGSSGRCIRAALPYIRTEIPIVIVFRALGFVADKDILEHICYDFADTQMMELLKPSLEEAFVIQNQEVALDYIGKRGVTVGVTKEKRITYARDILQKEMLPHVAVEEYCETKNAYYFGYIIHRLLLCALGRRAEDNMGGLILLLFRKLTSDLRRYAEKSVKDVKVVRLHEAIMGKTITSGLIMPLLLGIGGKRMQLEQGLVLNRMTYVSMLSQLRRVTSPIGCEGQACGLVKNLALMAYITVGSDANLILDVLAEWGLESFEEISPAVFPEATNFFANGLWVGIHRDPNNLVRDLKELRRKETRGGWFDLIANGLIEYIDTQEETSMISMTINDLVKARLNPDESYCDTYTHCEIHPSLILGVCASINGLTTTT